MLNRNLIASLGNIKIIGLMAATRDGVIGHEQGLPWKYDDEMEHFLQTSNNSILIMGHKTYLSTPKELFETRIPIVFSRVRRSIQAGYCVSSLEECIRALKELEYLNKAVYMIGGAEIAELFLSNGMISQFILTTIFGDFKGDCKMDMKYFKNAKETIRSENSRYKISEFNF